MASAPKDMKKFKFYEYKDHDPILDQMRTIKDGENLNFNQIAELTGQSRSTIDKWFNRSTKNGRKPTMRPMFSSVMNFSRAFGYDLRLVKPERRVSASTGVVLQRNIRAKSDIHNSGQSAHQ